MSASKLKWLTVLSILSALAVVGAAVRVFAFTPIEREMGLVQKVFYLQLPGWACWASLSPGWPG
jgi:hypothetical protein